MLFKIKSLALKPSVVLLLVFNSSLAADANQRSLFQLVSSNRRQLVEQISTFSQMLMQRRGRRLPSPKTQTRGCFCAEMRGPLRETGSGVKKEGPVKRENEEGGFYGWRITDCVPTAVDPLLIRAGKERREGRDYWGIYNERGETIPGREGQVHPGAYYAL